MSRFQLPPRPMCPEIVDVVFRNHFQRISSPALLRRSPALLPDVPGAGITLAEKPLHSGQRWRGSPSLRNQFLSCRVPWCRAESPVT